MRAAASSANLLIPAHSPSIGSAEYLRTRRCRQGPFLVSPALSVLDAEAVHAGPNLVAALHFGVLGRERVEVRAVAAAEVADANRAVGIGADFEVAAREKLVGTAHMTFAADDETVLRDLELLSVERTADADQNRAR